MPQPKYAVVIPAKNEQGNIADTLESVATQTVTPEICLVVDDGSDDDTHAIVQSYGEKYPFIKCIQRENKGSYILGGHVVSVFEHGRGYLDSIQLEYDYIVKLDADLSFDADHAEKIFAKIEGDNKWAVVSGTPFRMEGEQKIYEFSPQWHSQGQFKFYNRAFLMQTNGIPKSLGWDCADNIIAMDNGWKTAAFRDVHYEMFRAVGGKISLAKGRIKHGMGCYVLGYSPAYFFLRVIHDLIKPPLIIGSLSMLRGYLTAMFEHRERILNKNQQRLLRGLLWGSLLERLKNQEFEVFQKIKG